MAASDGLTAAPQRAPSIELGRPLTLDLLTMERTRDIEADLALTKASAPVWSDVVAGHRRCHSAIKHINVVVHVLADQFHLCELGDAFACDDQF